jgi:hypothetical protein
VRNPSYVDLQKEEKKPVVKVKHAIPTGIVPRHAEGVKYVTPKIKNVAQKVVRKKPECLEIKGNS